MIKSELYQITKSKVIILCLCLSIFYMLALALTYNYDYIVLPLRQGIKVDVSLNEFTEFMFKDYSLLIPITLIFAYYYTKNNLRFVVLVSKGIGKTKIFFTQLCTSYLLVLIYLVINILIGYVFFISISAYNIKFDYSFYDIIPFLILQFLCFCGYSTVIYIISLIVKDNDIVIIVISVLILVLNLWMPKLSGALGITYSLYNYWIMGLSSLMSINQIYFDIDKILITLAIYIFGFNYLAYKIFIKKSLFFKGSKV